MKKETKLIVALDTPSLAQAQNIVRELSGVVRFFKIGSQLFTACGPTAVEMVLKEKAEVFLDLKFHDIPNTVAQAALSALRLGVFMFNVHAAGGREMLLKAKDAVHIEYQRLGMKKPVILGVTVLTSMDRPQLNSIGIMRSVKNEVLHLAKLCKACGLDGVVCSGKEIKFLRKALGDDFILVAPGVRPIDSLNDDQKRIVTPCEAARLGADYIVVGRPIAASEDLLSAAKRILSELSGAITQ